MSKRIGIIVGAMLGVMLPLSALAGPFEYYGAGLHGMGMGTAVNYGADYGAVYYNPATLPDVKNHASVGAFATFSSAEIALKRRPEGYDIPNLEGSNTLASAAHKNSRRNTRGPQPIYAVTGGAVHDLGIEGFRIGFAAFLPVTELLRLDTHYPDERERYFSNSLSWELADQQPARIDFELGIGYRVFDWLQLGVGGSYLPSARATLGTYVPDVSDFSKVLLASHIDTESSWAVTGGVLFELPKQIRIGITTRTPIRFDIDAENDLQIRDVKDHMKQSIRWRPSYTPLHVDMGLSWHNDTFLFEFDGRFNKWDAYVDSTSNFAGFDNTFDSRLGVQYQMSENNTFRGGVSYIPTPVPDQTGRTNYVDNSRIRVSLGGSHRLSVSEFAFEVGWAAQLHIMVPRDTNKATAETYPNCSDSQKDVVCDEVDNSLLDPKTGKPHVEAQGLQTGNPGFPGWTSGGLISSLQLEIRI